MRRIFRPNRVAGGILTRCPGNVENRPETNDIPMPTCGHARVSTIDPDLVLQRSTLKAAD